MELNQHKAAFAERGIGLVAVSQEDPDLARASTFPGTFEEPPAFPLLADVSRARTASYDRASATYIDGEGIVRQLFPMMAHMRASAGCLLAEIDRLQA